jgi:two-component system cell cycle sensor histidine kinase/response regulator CckA
MNKPQKDKNSIEELIIQNEMYKKIFKVLPHQLLLIDPRNYEILFASPSDCPPNKLVKKTCYELIYGKSHPCCKTEHSCPLSIAREKKKHLFVEHTHLNSKGEQRIYEVQTYPIFNKEGEIIHILMDSIDVTDRKRIEKNLFEVKKRFKTIFDNANDGMLLADPQSKGFFMANKRMCDMLGYTLQEITQLQVMDIHPEESLPYVIDQFNRQLKKEITIAKDIPVKRKNRTVFYADVNSSPITFDGKTYLMGIFRDVTKRNAIEKKLMQRTNDYKERIKELNCLYAVSKLISDHRKNRSEILQTIVNIIPQSLHYPDIACARIIIDGNEFRTHNFRITNWKQSADIKIRDKNLGSLELYYLQQRPEEYEGPFLKEERDLVNALAAQIGIFWLRRDYAEELERSREKLRIIFEYAPDAIYIMDMKGNFVDGNRSAEQMVGCKREEMIGKNFAKLKLLSSGQIPKAVTLLARNAIRKPTGPDEFTLHKRDGTQVFAEIRTYPIRIEKKMLVLGIARDMTIRRQIEDALRTGKAYFEGLFQGSPEAVAMTDNYGNILRTNEAFSNLFGYSEREIQGRHIDTIVVAKQNENEAGRFTASVLAGENISSEGIRHRKDGSPVYVSIIGSPIIIDGKRAGIYAIYRNISERKAMETQRDKARTYLLQSQKMESIGRLAGGVAHEFNNLLTGVIGFAELLFWRLEDPSLKADVQSILKAAQQAASLAHQLLSFSQKKKMEFKQLNINPLIENIKPMLKGLVGDRIKMVYRLDPLLFEINSDSSLIEQIMVNLVQNGSDAMQAGGQLTIETRNITYTLENVPLAPGARSGNFANLLISDTGVGMSDEVIHRMFEPFFSTRNITERTGLGLSVVFGIVKQHGGWIDVESNPGKGCQFSIFLPAITNNAIAPYEKEDTSSKPFGNGESILVVEDEEVVRELAGRVLRDNGYVVVEAANATEAFDVFHSEKGNFDLVFTDVIMPGKNGSQLVNQLLLSKPNLKALFSSGYSDVMSQRAIIAEKGFPFLQKPYTPSDLILAVRDILGQ